MGLLVKIDCPVCEKKAAAKPYRVIDGFSYFDCNACGSLFIDPNVLAKVDRGESLRTYDDAYWAAELESARQRSRSDGLVRAGEAILYARSEVKRFLDVGAGPGYLLDQLSAMLPRHADLFHAVEMFPPEGHSRHPNYTVGAVGDLVDAFDAGVCIEVVEHLTPKMLTGLVEQLARVSHENTLWLFNTGLHNYVRNEDPGYLDPLGRGHIVSYSLPGLQKIFEPKGFRISAIPGKSYAFLAEFGPTSTEPGFSERFYSPVPNNRHLLEEAGLLYQAAFEAARSGYYHAEYMERTAWALSFLRR
ncbi:class I SAM-dependent methyltransferase [Dyella sp. Tek66A03]|uniref:class I SAM-dependent methyltransferase n=1 Tax=Dyella sp. Tek66A03 TaxID=3458298 RepID=UPI00403E5B0C